MTDILAKWNVAAPKVSSQALAQLYGSGKGKDPRGAQMLAIFKKRKDPKIGPKGKPGPTYTTLIFIDDDTKIRLWPKTKFPPKKDATASKDGGNSAENGDGGGGAPMEELYPETPDAQYTLLKTFQYTIKEWGTVINADLKSGDIVYVRGLQYKLYRESIGKPIQFSVQGIVEAVPNETLSTVMRRLIRERAAFLVKRSNDTHIPEIQQILGSDWRSANTDGKDWIPQQIFFIHVDQSIDPGTAVAEAELANEPYMFAKIPELPYDESFFVYPVTEKNLQEQPVFSGLGGTTPLAYQIAQGTTREDGTLIQAQFTLWPESLDRLYVPPQIWPKLGMNLAKGIVFDFFGKDNETRTASLPVNNMGTLDAQIVLKGKATMDLAATVKNVGIPISIDTAADIFDKTEIGELFRTKRRILSTSGNWEDGILKNLTRHEYAMNLNIVNGYVTRLIKEVENGNVALYAIVNTAHTPESRSSEREGRKFLEPLLAKDDFIGCVFAVSKKEPIKDLFVGGASGGVSSSSSTNGLAGAVKTFSAPAAPSAPVTDKPLVDPKPKAVAVKPAEEEDDSDSDVVPPPAKKQKKEVVEAVEALQAPASENEEASAPKKEKTKKSKKEKSKKSKKDKKSKKSKKRKTDSSDDDESESESEESSEESSEDSNEDTE